MEKIPWKGKLYLIGISIIGVVFLYFAIHHCWRYDHLSLLIPVLLTCLAVSGHIEIAIGMGSLSIAFVVIFATLLRYGPEETALVAGVSGLMGTLISRKNQTQPWYRYTFNMGSLAITGWAASCVYQMMGGSLSEGSFEQGITSTGAAALVYFFLNTLSVSHAIGLVAKTSTFRIWKEHFLWTAPSYFAAATCSIMISQIDSARGLIALTAVLPILFLIYYSCLAYSRRIDDDINHLEQLHKKHRELSDLYLSTVESLATAIEAKDQYTNDHIRRVQQYAVETAKELGITGEELEGIRIAALLHDVGKLGIPDHILSKQGRLSAEEKKKVEDHSKTGAKILEPVSFQWSVAQMVRSHHERFNGEGYPDGLCGEDIPLGARILAVADVFDALTSDRPYREAMQYEKALETVRQLSGSMFDPIVVRAFIRIIYRVILEIEPPFEENLLLSETEQPNAQGRTEYTAYEEIARANQEILALYEIAETVGTNLNLSETLNLLLNKIANIIPSSACAILLHDKENHEYRPEIVKGISSDQLFQMVVHEGEGLTGQSIASGAQIISPDSPGCELNHFHGIKLSSALVGPLVYDIETLGTINLYHENTGFFTEDHRRLLGLICRQSAVAIRNAMLFQETQESAMTDNLTGLANSRYLYQFLEQEISRSERSREPVSILLMDLDDFKPINDKFGHRSGDKVLCDLGIIFRSQLREYDVVARYAGDEFVVIMPSAGSEEAEIAVTRIKRAVSEYSWELIPGRTVRVGISIGIATYPRDGLDSSTLITAADTRMYEDKNQRKKIIESSRV